MERLQRALEGGKLARLEISRRLAEGWSGKSEQVREELRVWARWWHDLLLIKLGLGAHVSQGDDLRHQADRYTLDQVRAAIATLVQARADLDQNVNPRLALDVALLKLPRPVRVA